MNTRFTEHWDAVDPLDEGYPHLWIKVEHLGRYLFAARLLKEFGAARVADVGCGTGYGSRVLKSVASEVIGIDNQPLALSSPGDTGQVADIEFCLLEAGQGELERRFGIERFDAIVCFEMIEHSLDPAAILKEFHAVTRPGGLMICSVPNGVFEGTGNDGLATNKYHRRVFSIAGITSLLESAGFRVLEVLGQPLVADISRNEARNIRRRLVDSRIGDERSLHTPENVKRLAMTMALPEQRDVERSHSLIVVAERIESE